ncbi:TniB family NTP-binding protein [Pseudomonas fluorescens]|uniref:Uncharacterized protein n=1 Tax=Pseudomonas fluorescens TaxID=294 RepID=A0A5E7SNR4_PSEFL|nr:TniB family NTP-binding protein [Pseudomonas fluorescens]VVP87734.1 hypothetical protein PS941_01375 [Pseudomonas fluorescens]
MSTMLDSSHLHPQVRFLLDQPNTARLEYVVLDRWINHAACSAIRNKAKSLLFLPHTTQATCFMIVGTGGTGKSSLLDRIAKDSESWSQRQAIAPGHIILKLSAEPTLANIIRTLCEQFGITNFNLRKDDIPAELSLIMRARGIKFILIDEFHHLLTVNRVEQRKNLNFFKNLSGPPLSLNIIAFGTHEALNAINLDIQLLSRFQVFELPQWKPNDELRAFLASYEKYMPLRLPSNLASKEIVQFLSTTLELTTRNIVNRLKWAALQAITDGTEKIQLENLTNATSIPDLTSIYEVE